MLIHTKISLKQLKCQLCLFLVDSKIIRSGSFDCFFLGRKGLGKGAN